MSIDVQTAPNQVSLLRTSLGQSLNIGLKHFDLDYLQGKQCITRTASGRGTVYFFKQGKHELVLRHYHRGGVIGKLNKDKFIFIGMEQTRAFMELNILEFLHSRGLHVSQAVAARITRKGLLYQADIMTLAIPAAQEMHEILKQCPVDDEIWHVIGVTLGELHKLNVRHDDINVKNVLVQSDGRVALIDFDNCQQQALGNWKSANIARFYRSLIKQHSMHKPYYFAQSNWETLQVGYATVVQNQ